MPSLRRMRQKLQRQVIRWTLWGTVFLIFVIGIFSGFNWIEQRVQGEGLNPVIAVVDGTQITRQEFERRLVDRLRLHSPSVKEWGDLKRSLLQEFIDDILLRKEARRRGLRVTRADIAQRVEEIVRVQMARARRRYEEDKRFRDIVRKRYGSLANWEKEVRDRLWEQSHDWRPHLLHEKLQEALRQEIEVTDEDLKAHYTRYKVRHIFVRIDRSLPEGEKKGSDRQKARGEALKRARRLRQRALGGEDFATLARKESDDPVTAKRGGEVDDVTLDVARWRFGEKAPEFLRKAEIGAISPIIEGLNGFHILKVEGKKVTLPPDFNDLRYRCENGKCRYEWVAPKGEKECPKCKGKKIKVIGERKEELRQNLRDRLFADRWFQLLSRLRQEAHIEILDPELKAFWSARFGDQEEAKKLLEKALEFAEQNPYARARYILPEALSAELARLYFGEGKFKEAERHLRAALRGSDDPELHLELGRALMMQGKKEEALKIFQALMKEPLTPFQRFNLADYLEQLGEKEMAKKQREVATKGMASQSLQIPLTPR